MRSIMFQWVRIATCVKLVANKPGAIYYRGCWAYRQPGNYRLIGSVRGGGLGRFWYCILKGEGGGFKGVLVLCIGVGMSWGILVLYIEGPWLAKCSSPVHSLGSVGLTAQNRFFFRHLKKTIFGYNSNHFADIKSKIGTHRVFFYVSTFKTWITLVPFVQFC